VTLGHGVADDAHVESPDARLAAPKFRRFAKKGVAHWPVTEQATPGEWSLAVDDAPQQRIHSHPEQGRLGIGVDHLFSNDKWFRCVFVVVVER
jgi:hypothetical protein